VCLHAHLSPPSPNPRIINTSDRAQRNLLTAKMTVTFTTLTPLISHRRKIKSTVCLNKPTHPGDDCHPHAFQLIPLPNSRNTKSLKLLLLGTYSTQRRFRLYTFQFLSPNSRFTNSNQGEELLDTPFRLLSVLDVSTLLYLPLCTPNRRLQTLFTTSPPTVIIHNSPYRISTILVTLHHEADEY
jgi:hypothetical protein